MKVNLKIMAPFAIEGFDLNATRILQTPADYQRLWDEADKAFTPERLGQTGDHARLVSHRFTHASAFTQQVGSRYRSIDTHSLARPIHALELIVREPGADWPDFVNQSCKTFIESSREPVSPALHTVRDAIASQGQAQPPQMLVRVFDHGVALLEMDLPLPASTIQAANPNAAHEHPAMPDQLDALQQLGIALGEAAADIINDNLLAPLFTWLHEQPLGQAYLRGQPPQPNHRTAATSSRAMWVTRSLIITEKPLDDDQTAARNAMLEHWLKDLADAPDSIARCRQDPAATSTSWLNYFFGEASYNAGPAHAYPAHGWGRMQLNHTTTPNAHHDQQNHKDRAAPFCHTWDAMLIAQYYYAAFDRLQSMISRILAISVAGEGRRSVNQVKRMLDAAIRDAKMLKIEFEENSKYYARQVATQVAQILAGWGFETNLRAEVDKRIEDCVERLNDLHARAIERSSIYTDLILLAIGITAVFEVLLYLAEYGRTMTADADLAIYDSTSWGVAGWIGASSTDAVLLAAAVFSIGLTLLYAYFRTSKSRV